ncbi:energy transducer TonB [Flavobacterium sp.]|uniref:energy transducer TonB n=1 Tax=Flavobacterium sp. TaxID=239 RepID=UPI002FD8BB5C
MRNLDQYPKVNHNGKLYFQVGLLASLVLAYLVIEMETPSRSVEVPDSRRIVDISEKPFPSKLIVETKEEPKPKTNEVKPRKLPVFLNQVKPTSNDSPDPDPQQTVPIDDLPEDLPLETTPVSAPVKTPDFVEKWALEETPTFQKCAGLKGAEREACFREQMSKFLSANLNYPERARDRGEQGSILVEFIVDTDGKITQVKPAYSKAFAYADLEKEAIRVVSKLPKLTPGKQAGKPVRVRYTVPITFKMGQ